MRNWQKRNLSSLFKFLSANLREIMSWKKERCLICDVVEGGLDRWSSRESWCFFLCAQVKLDLLRVIRARAVRSENIWRFHARERNKNIICFSDGNSHISRNVKVSWHWDEEEIMSSERWVFFHCQRLVFAIWWKFHATQLARHHIELKINIWTSWQLTNERTLWV